MDGNGVHTSVVIEVANQEEPEDQKMYKIDFDEREPPKDYVIDQIFCGENLTIYALFEVPDATTKKSGNQLVEVTDAAALNDDYRFYHRNSFKKKINESRSGCMRNILTVNSSKSDNKLLSKDRKNKSFYCLKTYGEIPNREEENLDFEVLYCKDMVPTGIKSTKFKAVSKGINTDITQSPKLLEEIHRILSGNSTLNKNDGKPVYFTSHLSLKPSQELDETGMVSSTLSFSSDVDNANFNENSSASVLLVPLFMVDEGNLTPNKKEESRNKSEGEKIEIILKSVSAPDRCSVSVSTDFEDLKSTISKNLMKDKSCQSETEESPKTEELDFFGLKPKPSTKKTIIEEIKSLQEKLNSLLSFMELNSSVGNSDGKISNDKKHEEKTHPNQGMKKIETELVHVQKNQRNFDDIPIFSSLNFAPTRTKNSSHKSKKKLSSAEKEKCLPVAAVKSTASNNFVCKKESLPKSNLCENYNEKFSEEIKNCNWDFTCRKNAEMSKSMANFFINIRPKYLYTLKKSQSFDTSVKSDALVLKKIKTLATKLDYCQKKKDTPRIHKNKENPLGDNLALQKYNKKKNEIIKKPENLDVDFFVEPPNKNKALIESVEKYKFEPNNKEEGDAKITYNNNNNLVNSQLVEKGENVTVHYCSTITPALNGLIKSDKNLVLTREKLKNRDKSVEGGIKGSSDSEKPFTPVRSHRRVTHLSGKKEIKIVKKDIDKFKVTEKLFKNDKKEPSLDTSKPKSVVITKHIRIKNRPETKLHVDKLIKKGADDTKVDEISGQKPYGRLSHIPSQKQQRRECFSTITNPNMKDKEGGGVSQKNSVFLMKVNSTQLIKDPAIGNMKENASEMSLVKTKVKKTKETFKALPQENGSLLPSPSPSVVVLELFSKKPPSIDDLHPECGVSGENSVGEKTNSKSTTKCTSDSVNIDNQIVKSVWALTKLLLFEDGTKKFEILEASLAPPEYSLNKNSDYKIR